MAKLCIILARNHGRMASQTFWILLHYRHKEFGVVLQAETNENWLLGFACTHICSNTRQVTHTHAQTHAKSNTQTRSETHQKHSAQNPHITNSTLHSWESKLGTPASTSVLVCVSRSLNTGGRRHLNPRSLQVSCTVMLLPAESCNLGVFALAP